MDSNSDTDSSVGDDFLSTVGSIRSDIQTQADDIRKDFENIKIEQKAIEEKRLAEFEEMKKAEEEKAEEMRLKRKEKKERRRRVESARERGEEITNLFHYSSIVQSIHLR